MDIATVLFTYNRSGHTKIVLDALASSEQSPQKLFIFHDGKKTSTNVDEWNRVETIIRSVKWCDTEVITSDHNKGLADSVISGMDYVFSSFDAAIVLEDDCVPHKSFMSFMTDCLRRYCNEKTVWNISGLGWPVELQPSEYDCYFNQRFSSWGWGTWKDRWKFYERDYKLVAKIYNDTGAAERLKIWGSDLIGQVHGNIDGKCDSWAVFWALKIIEKNGICVNPYSSLINYTGDDGSGTHSGTSKMNIISRDQETKWFGNFPPVIEVKDDTKKAFSLMTYRSTVEERLSLIKNLLIESLKLYKRDKLTIPGLEYGDDYKNIRYNIAIWGVGALCDYVIDSIADIYFIDTILLTHPYKSSHRGIPVRGVDDFDVDLIQEKWDAVIVVPYNEKSTISEMLSRKGISLNLIGIDDIVLNTHQGGALS